MPGIRDVVAGMFERWERALADGVRSMQASGRVCADLDADAAGATLVAAIQGAVVLMLATGSADRLRTVLRTELASMHA